MIADQYEPILDPSLDRLILFPIKYNELWDSYKSAVAAFWVPEEVDLTRDTYDFNNKLTKDEQYYIK